MSFEIIQRKFSVHDVLFKNYLSCDRAGGSDVWISRELNINYEMFIYLLFHNNTANNDGNDMILRLDGFSEIEIHFFIVILLLFVLKDYF